MGAKRNLDRMTISKIPCELAINNGICKADCCRVVCIPFLKKFYDINFHRMKRKPEEIIELGNILYLFRQDTTCVYLDDETNKCNIYEDRPFLCACYGCIYGCLHYDRYGSLLSSGKRKRKMQTHDSNESVIKQFEQLKQATKIGYFKTNTESYKVLVSDATPISIIKIVAEKIPNLIEFGK